MFLWTKEQTQLTSHKKHCPLKLYTGYTFTWWQNIGYLYHANNLIFREYSEKFDNSTHFPVMEMSARAYLWCVWQQEIFYWENIRLKSTEAPPPSNTTASQSSYCHITIHTQLQIWHSQQQTSCGHENYATIINVKSLRHIIFMRVVQIYR